MPVRCCPDSGFRRRMTPKFVVTLIHVIHGRTIEMETLQSPAIVADGRNNAANGAKRRG